MTELAVDEVASRLARDCLCELPRAVSGLRWVLKLAMPKRTLHRGPGTAIALTFDDGPSDETVQILDCLEEHDAVGTFFVLGQHIAGREHVLRRMVELGCEIGNHTFAHPRLSALSDEDARTELQRCSDAIRAVVRHSPRLMRPPYGDHSPATPEVAERLGLGTVLWTIPTRDWDGSTGEMIADRILEAVRPGGVVVLHDGSAEGADRGPTVDAVRIVVPAILERGHRLVTVSQLLRLDRRARLEIVVLRRGSFRWMLAAAGRRLRGVS